MTSKERVLTSFAHQEPDRVPINYCGNRGIDGRLKAHFGLEYDDDEGLRQALEVDFRNVDPPYIGAKLHDDIPERGIKSDAWGIRRKWIAHDTGGYWDFVDFPLQNATEEDMMKWSMPAPDDYDYRVVKEACHFSLNSATRDVIDDLVSPNNIRALGLKKRGSSRG